MAGSKNRHQVNTTVDPELYQKMKDKGIKSSYALMVGIRTVLGMETAYTHTLNKMHGEKMMKVIKKLEEQSDKMVALEKELAKYRAEEAHRME